MATTMAAERRRALFSRWRFHDDDDDDDRKKKRKTSRRLFLRQRRRRKASRRRNTNTHHHHHRIGRRRENGTPLSAAAATSSSASLGRSESGETVADAIVVVAGGFTPDNTWLPEWVLERLDYCAEAYKRAEGKPYICIAGSATPHKSPPLQKGGFIYHESTMMAEYLIDEHDVHPRENFEGYFEHGHHRQRIFYQVRARRSERMEKRGGSDVQVPHATSESGV